MRSFVLVLSSLVSASHGRRVFCKTCSQNARSISDEHGMALERPSNTSRRESSLVADEAELRNLRASDLWKAVAMSLLASDPALCVGSGGNDGGFFGRFCRNRGERTHLIKASPAGEAIRDPAAKAAIEDLISRLSEKDREVLAANAPELLRGIEITQARQLERDTLSSNLLEAEYAVRGEILDKAEELQRQIDANPTGHGLPFDSFVACNIGNPQSLGQQPLSFNRQVLSLVINPQLIEMAEGNSTLGAAFQPDAVARARSYLSRIPEGLGAYTHSQGIPIVREEVSRFIEARDGHPCAPDNIFLTDGASAGVRMIYQAMFRPGQPDGMLVPIPQYPLYSALTTLFGGQLVGYYLDESHSWKVTEPELRRALMKARAGGTSVRGLVVINPGNPTGQCLDVQDMKDILDFCRRENLVLLADEVYQENIIAKKSFTSFRKVLLDSDAPDAVQLVSFHSVSKGFLGECGVRGGYFELMNIDAEVKAQLYKLASVTLCANSVGQLSIGLMVNPPQSGDASHESYTSERDDILSSLKRRALKLREAFIKMEGVSCNPPEGAMYLFPQIKLPQAAIAAAKKAGMAPDTFYCMSLLQETGLITVPGTGFKQVDGTFHFRTTFLPAEDQIDQVIKRFGAFNAKFMKKYRR